jgi:hypothetical protein
MQQLPPVCKAPRQLLVHPLAVQKARLPQQQRQQPQALVHLLLAAEQE